VYVRGDRWHGGFLLCKTPEMEPISPHSALVFDGSHR